jgi:hypothetical protein
MSEEIKTESSAQTPAQPATGSAISGPAVPEPTTTNRKLVFGIIVFVVLFIVITVLVVILAVNNPGPTAVFRDLFIILLALVSIAIGGLMLVLIFQLQSLIALLRNEIKPMLTNANETVNTVRGTAVFVSDNLVKPTIGLASFAAGVRGAQQAFMGKVNSMSRRPASARKAQGKSANQPK